MSWGQVPGDTQEQALLVQGRSDLVIDSVDYFIIWSQEYVIFKVFSQAQPSFKRGLIEKQCKRIQTKRPRLSEKKYPLLSVDLKFCQFDT